jgi:PPM family protein phosphatase
MAAKIVSYAASDIGKHRSSNQDSGYAGYQLFFVADGMGGHAGGDIASAIASQRIALSDYGYDTADEAVESLRQAILDANSMLSSTVAEHPELEGMGTTFSGLLMVQGRAITAHIGDSRIYLARDGEVRQITADHTFVQRLVEMGKITAEEALVHPRRSVLMRVLGDVTANPEIDLAIYDTKPGDRWMLCSDGLSGVVPQEVFERILLSRVPTEEAAELLVGEALEFGAPDNVTVVIADVVRAAAEVDFEPSAQFVGSAANEVVIEERRGGKILQLLNPKSLVDLLTPPEDPTKFAPESEELLEKILNETKKKLRWRVWRAIASWLALAGIVVGIITVAYNYTQTRFYVADYQGQVTIFQGIREELGPLKFSRPFLISEVETAELPDFERTQVVRSISAENLVDAERILTQLKARVDE